jgi:pimeloyl-ACP methyl ester carboxylesterase
VSVVGGSFGGGAAGDAAIEWPGEIDRVVFLGAAPNLSADKLKCRSLFIVARDDASGDGPRLPGIRAQYAKAPNPKQLIVLDGSAHAQFLFQTSQRRRTMLEILKFLSAPWPRHVRPPAPGCPAPPVNYPNDFNNLAPVRCEFYPLNPDF